MPVVVTHTKVSAIADDPTASAAGQVLPSDWNANHTLTGLGTMAEQAANNVSITGGSITGITDLAVADGGTGASDASGARTNLGLGTMATQASSSVSITGGTLSGVTLTDPGITGTILEDIYTITDGAAFEIDPSNGSIQLITLGASRTPKATNFSAGESVTMMIDDGTAYTITWTDATFGGSGVVWKTDGGVAPTLNTSGYTVIVLWKVSTQVYGARVGNA